MKDFDINWALAFACLAFSGMWLAGLGAQIPIETTAVRATIGLLLGAGVGFGVDLFIRQLAPLAKIAAPRGTHVNFTASDESDEPPPMASIESDFRPLDFKTAARHVETIAQD